MNRVMAPLLGLALFAAAGFTPLSPAAEPPRPPGEPERPRLLVDTAPVPAPPRTRRVPAGGDLQAALDAARSGEVIELEAGATFEGPFTLPRKPGSGWIVVRTASPDSRLTQPGARLGPAQAGTLPKLISGSGPVISTRPGAHHYRFVGIEFRPSEGAFLTNLILLGSGETSQEDLPHHIVFDRCYLHGDPRRGGRRGIAMNSGYTAVVDSHLSDFKEVGADSQAIAGWNGPGPFRIVNNYLEGAGENVMFGGADPSIRGLVPSDIEIRRNHFAKPLTWRLGDPSYAGTPWSVKNLLEFKNARRVLVEGNLFENNWAHAQSGFAILLTVRNEDGNAPWSVVEDVTFTNNVVRRVAAGINILGRDDNRPSEQTRRILIRNNLFEDVGGGDWGGTGTLFQMLLGTADTVIEHNTAFQTGSIIMAEGTPHTGFVYRHNISLHNAYGIAGTGTGPGNSTLRRYFPGAAIQKNVFVGGEPGSYPPGNFFAPSPDRVGFVDIRVRRYDLAGTSPYSGAAANGRDIGIDTNRLAAAMGPLLGVGLAPPTSRKMPTASRDR